MYILFIFFVKNGMIFSILLIKYKYIYNIFLVKNEMDYNILELLLNSNPASATALLAVLILFFYNLFKKFDKKAVRMINDHDDAVTKNVDKMNNMILHVDSIVNNISENVKSLNFQISSIQERIKNIENSDIDGKLELLYLKKDIEAIKRYMDVHYLSNITFRNSRNKKE